MKDLLQAVKEAISVDVGGSITSYLPSPLANEIIAMLREQVLVRQLCRTFPMATRTWKKPKRGNYGSAYYIPDGVTATLTGMSSTSVEWVAKKLMHYMMVDMEAIEDSQPDVVAQVIDDGQLALAEAEEMALMSGDPTHVATAPTPDAATTANWYVRDPRLMFEGIFTVAASADASTEVVAAGAKIDVDMVNIALYNLGKYGRNRNNIRGLASSDQAANLRMDSNFKNAATSGQALASFITGLNNSGQGGVAGSIVQLVYGIPIHEAPWAPAGEVCLFHKQSPELGDRRQIKFRREEVIESDQEKMVVSERIAFNFNWRDALCLISGLDSTVD